MIVIDEKFLVIKDQLMSSRYHFDQLFPVGRWGQATITLTKLRNCFLSRRDGRITPASTPAVGQ
jgi:hypothetical protein